MNNQTWNNPYFILPGSIPRHLVLIIKSNTDQYRLAIGYFNFKKAKFIYTSPFIDDFNVTKVCVVRWKLIESDEYALDEIKDKDFNHEKTQLE